MKCEEINTGHARRLALLLIWSHVWYFLQSWVPGRGRLIPKWVLSVIGCDDRLPSPRHGVPLWPLPLLRSQAGFSSECSVEQIVDKSQIWGRMAKQEEKTGEYLMQKSGTQFLKQRFPREKDVSSWETAHILHMMWTLHKEWMIFCLQTFQDHVFESRKDQRSICCTWSSSLRRVIRWKGSIRNDLRDRRWQTGSLSSFSKTSRKLLLLFLDGAGRLRGGEDGE